MLVLRLKQIRIAMCEFAREQLQHDSFYFHGRVATAASLFEVEVEELEEDLKFLNFRLTTVSWKRHCCVFVFVQS